MDLEGDTISLCGLIGVLLFSPLLVISLYHYWIGLHLFTTQNLLHPKLIFFSSMILYSFLELIYFINLMYSNGISRLPYCSHIFALFFYVFSFSVVIYLWGSTMSFDRKFTYPYYAGVTVVALNLIIDIIAVITVGISSSFTAFQEHYWLINLIFTMMHSICLMILSLSMLWYGIQLQLKLTNSTVKSVPGKNTKLSIILRINGMLTVCNVCFFLRVVALGLLCSDIILSHYYVDKTLGNIGWFLLSNWCPTLIPAFTLVTMLRVKEGTRTSAAHIRTDHNRKGPPIERPTDDMDRDEISTFEQPRELYYSEDIGTNPVHQNTSPQKNRTSSAQSFHIESGGDEDEEYYQ